MTVMAARSVTGKAGTARDPLLIANNLEPPARACFLALCATLQARGPSLEHSIVSSNPNPNSHHLRLPAPEPD